MMVRWLFVVGLMLGQAAVPLEIPLGGEGASVSWECTPDNAAIVTKYLLTVSSVAAPDTVVMTVDMGKPALPPVGPIQVPMPQFSTLPEGVYVATVRAIGTAETDISPPAQSNTFRVVKKPPVPVLVNCAVSDWSEFGEWTGWRAIDVTTETRSRSRTRTVVTPPENGGTVCPELEDVEVQTRLIVVPPLLTVTKSERCLFTLVAQPPDATGGWTAKFWKGIYQVGVTDSIPPYSALITYLPGTYTFRVTFTKTGRTMVEQTITPIVCNP